MTIHQVGTTTEFDSSATSGASGSFTRSCAAGSVLIVVTQGNCNITTPSGWTLAKQQTCSDAPSYQTNIYFKTGLTAGSLSQTFNRSGSTGGFRGTVVEYSGMGAATVDKTSGFGFYANTTGTAFPTTGTLSAAVELAIAGFYAAAGSGDTITGPSGWTTVSTSNVGTEYLVASLVTSSTAGLTPYWSPGGGNVENANALVTFVPGPPPTAPVLTLSSPTSLTATSVNINVNSNLTGGVTYVVCTQTNTQPSTAQIEAVPPTDAAGFVSPGAQGPGVSGASTINVTGLSPSTTYYVWALQDNGSVSNVPTQSFTTYPPPPTISSVSTSTPRYHGSLTVNFENGGASQGTVTIGGVAQTITSWTSLHAVISSVARGSNKYGTSLDVVVTSAIGSPSTPVSVSLLPQTGYDYTDLGTPLTITSSADRVEATADIASSDQIAYDTRGGLVLMYPDGSARVDPSLLGGGTGTWNVEAWTASGGWGSLGLQSITEGGGTGTSFVANFFGAAASTVGYVFGASVSTLARQF